MSHFPDALRAEMTALEAELKGDPRYRKLEVLRAALAVYDDTNDVVGESASKSNSPVRRGNPTPRQPSESRIKALHLAREYLTGRDEPVTTRELFEHLVSQGAEIGGERPANNLSAMLYNSKQFVSHGRAGWTLPREGEPVDNGPADASDRGDPLKEDAGPAVSAAVPRFVNAFE